MEKVYCQRKHLCSAHIQADVIELEDGRCRFCFQCGKLEPLSCFDGKKRTCRQRLMRRRCSPNSTRRRSHHHHPASGGRQQPAASARGAHTLARTGAAAPSLARSPPEVLPLPAGLLQPKGAAALGLLGCSSSNGSNTSQGNSNGPLCPPGRAPGAPRVRRSSSSSLLVAAMEADVSSSGCGDSYDGTGARWSCARSSNAGVTAAAAARPWPHQHQHQHQQLLQGLCVPVPVPALSLDLTPATTLDEQVVVGGPTCLELLLEAELAAAAAASSLQAASAHDTASRELSWKLAAAVVENSLALSPAGGSSGQATWPPGGSSVGADSTASGPVLRLPGPCPTAPQACRAGGPSDAPSAGTGWQCLMPWGSESPVGLFGGAGWPGGSCCAAGGLALPISSPQRAAQAARLAQLQSRVAMLQADMDVLNHQLAA